MLSILKIFSLLFLLSCSQQGKNPNNPVIPESAISRNYEMQSTNPADQSIVNFGSIYDNEQKTISLKITNTSVQNISGTTSISNANFVILSQNCSLLKPKSSCSVRLSFDAKNKEGTYSSELFVAGVALSIQIEVVPSPEIILVENIISNQNSIDFGQVSSSQLKTIVFTNQSNISINKGSFLGMGQNSPFKIISDSCSNRSLAIKSSCSVRISLDSTNKNLGIVNDSFSFGTIPVLLSGEIATGIASGQSRLVLSYENIHYFHKLDSSFSSNVDTIKSIGDVFILNLKNIGSSPADIDNLSFSNNSKLQILSNSCSLLKPKSSCSIRVRVMNGLPEFDLNLFSQTQNISFPLKILSPDGSLCTINDAIVNGWDSYRSVKAGGEKTVSDISQCNLAKCEDDYEINPQDKKCNINLDSSNSGIVSNTQIEKLFFDISQNKASPIITLDHNKIYEFDSQIEVPSNVTIQGTSLTQRPIVRKKSNSIEGISKTTALTIKNMVEAHFTNSSLPANQKIVFNQNGEVLSYGGLSDVNSFKQSMQAINDFIEQQGYLNAYFVNLKNKYYRFDVANFGSRCVLSELISSVHEEYSTLCSGNIPAGTRRWSPFYQEILNSPDEELSSLNPNVAEPIFLLTGENITLKNLAIECPENVPYFPVNNLENISESNPFGSVKIIGGIRESAAISMSGVWAYNAKNIKLNNIRIDNCALGVYTINSQAVEISDSQIMTSIDPSGIQPLSQRKTGDIGLKWNRRFHGYNSIRIHGTLDRNFLIKNNTIGEVGRGSIKGIHIHGTSLSGRDSDNDDLPNNPPQGFSSEDEGLTKLAAYANKLESHVLRKNMKIIGNLIQGHHNAGIDIEGDQLNIDIRSNTISNNSNKLFLLHHLPGSIVSNSVGAGIRILTQQAPSNLFNFFSAGNSYSKFFYGSTHNLNIESNIISNNELGIYFIGGVNSNTLAFNNFPEEMGTSNILSNVANDYNCGLLSMRENCSLKTSIKNNQFLNILKSPSIANGNSAALQSYCIYIQDAIGLELKNNSFNTCNIPDYNFLGTGSAIRVVNSHKIHFGLGNNFSISNEMANTRQGLLITNTSGWNRYVSLSLANSPSFTRYVPSELNLTGCSGNCTAYLNLTSGYPAPANLAPTTETPAPFNDEASVPFKFMGSLELDAIQE